MRYLLAAIAFCAFLAVGYACWPLLAAYEVRQAIKIGDVATLERKVHWAPVRASLKDSLAQLPPAVARGDADAAEPASASPRPSLWSRVKAAVEPMIADHLIDTYVTASGISQLRDLRRAPFLSILGVPKSTLPPKAGPVDRFLAFYRKIVHARFNSLSQVEFEIADQPKAARHLLARLELSDLEWKLVSLRVIGAAR